MIFGYVVAVLLLFACTSAPVDSSPPPIETAETAETAARVEPYDVGVTVLLDGSPAAGTLVMQGGGREQWTTDADGRATVRMDPTIVGDAVVLAAHPEARIQGVEVTGPGDVSILLVRFDTTDNLLYENADPGPEDHESTTTAQCNHCHVTIQHGWYQSPHRTSASNPVVHDVYAGTGSFAAEDCAGEWAPGVEPGTGASVDQCFVASAVRETGANGACADCHAPGIDGELGGRDLLEATGVSYEAGVHCDVCHHVASVDLTQPPGVAGRLGILRPSERATSPGMGEWQPLTFGPYIDVVNPRMGSVYSPLFHSAELCAGCHEQEQAGLVGDVDRTRWPDGLLPIHSTYSEWAEGPMNPSAPCQSCHMPPMPDVGNSADLYNLFTELEVGIAGGWERSPGAVRAHSFLGPRQDAGMLESAASIDISTSSAEEVLAEVTVTNVGPGHAIPTGEPLRSLILLVEATCEGAPLAPVGGDVVSDVGGAEEVRVGGDWSDWPDARPGDVLRVTRRTGEWRDYEGPGRFGDGSFTEEDKGIPVEEYVGSVTVLEDGTFDAPLPAGDVVYRTSDQGFAGLPGSTFARVLVGADGARGVPHFLAVDVASDNRLLPNQGWTSTHRFAACAAPEIHATLLHRDYPLALARERGWTVTDRVMVESRR